ncbi:hypothetical protein AGLY_008477 [Aphis glycines]|uniref:Uncharacterized protein n=1 Tax=Aphis glycines TaxID=307491 RepID=A0A6G0TKZ5_APHGL|nr:hypothetical protein AGLY_008477 [Aphis glycines]
MYLSVASKYYLCKESLAILSNPTSFASTVILRLELQSGKITKTLCVIDVLPLPLRISQVQNQTLWRFPTFNTVFSPSQGQFAIYVTQIIIIIKLLLCLKNSDSHLKKRSGYPYRTILISYSTAGARLHKTNPDMIHIQLKLKCDMYGKVYIITIVTGEGMEGLGYDGGIYFNNLTINPVWETPTKI